MKCFFCQGPAHPATGCQYTPNVIACWRCTIEAFRWVREHTNKRAGKKHVKTALSFYEAAAFKG